ncbi:MAG TPA: ATP-binding protein [Gemmataceae bacterium]|nr:ATP-binding protein [Gemmataceae bacterium]
MNADPNAMPAAAREADRAAARLVRLLAVLQKGLGHELPNRLAAVQGLARLLELEEGERLSADGREYLWRLATGAEKAHALVTALAEVACLGKPAPPAGAVDVAEVVAEAVAEVKQLAPGRSVEYHASERTLLLSAPRLALRKVLVVLLRHAASAGTEVYPLQVAVSPPITDTEVEVRVAVGGPAIPPEKMDRLFEPFTGADDPGLELFLVRQLAEDWGGVVRAESGRDSGTVFIVTCPLVLSP